MTQKPSDRFLRAVLFIIQLISYAVVLRMLVYFAPRGALNIAWSPLLLVTLVSFVIMTSILYVFSSPQYRSRTTFWFSLYLVAILASQVSGSLSQFSASFAGYTYWTQITMLGACVIPLGFFFFVMTYMGKEEYLYKPMFWAGYVAAVLLLYRAGASNSVTDYSTAVLTRWGWQPVSIVGPMFMWSNLWQFSLPFLSVALLLWHLPKVVSPEKRRQGKMVILALVLINIIVTPAALIPALHPFVYQFLSVGQVVEVGVIAYAIARYGLFNVDSTSLSDTVLATMNESVITVNNKLEIENVNPSAAKTLGLNPAVTVGLNLRDVMNERVLKVIEDVIGHGIEKSVELTMPVQHSHNSLPVSLLVSPIINSNQTVAGHILVFRDITRERDARREIEHEVTVRTQQLHEAQAKLSASIESLSVGFMVIDPDGRISLRNSAMDDILGTGSNAELSFGQFAAVFTQPPRAAHRLQNAFEKRKVCELKDIKSGTKFLRIFLAPVFSNDGHERFLGAVVLLEDQTEEKILERSKEEFFSIASHELRTPLTSIKGNASMILTIYKKLLKEPDLKEMIGDIYLSSARLIEIVNDFLDASRLEQGRMVFRPETFALDKVVEETFYEMSSVLSSKGIYLKMAQEAKTLGKLPLVYGDRNRTKQVIYNLIGNAAKFTIEGGITVSVTHEGKLLKLRVIDTGKGIDPDMQALLFRKFQQAGNSLLTRDTSRGAGLGLYISRLIAQSMGGSLALEKSVPDVGSTFTFSIPLATEKQKTLPPVTKLPL